jgi:hypothetical protein
VFLRFCFIFSNVISTHLEFVNLFVCLFLFFPTYGEGTGWHGWHGLAVNTIGLGIEGLVFTLA